tara:strand:+ start:7263 stop:8282 length:1020 start_codon:yes stop_codon:yes gene_type:complete
MSESNSILDQVTSEGNNDGFDASAFISSETAKDVTSIEETNKPEVQAQEAVQAENTSEQKVEASGETSQDAENDSNDFSWDNIEVDEKPQETKEPEQPKEEDWDAVDSKNDSFNWDEVGSELGVKAKSKDEFVQQVKNLIENPVNDNEKIQEVQEFIKRNDEDLVIADMQASKFDDDYIEDTVTKLKESGLLKREALQIRTQLQKFVQKERENIKNNQLKSERENVQAQQKAKQELQSHIKGKTEFFGGKINSEEKRKLYNYITKGDFSKEIFDTHANVADAAFLWRNKDKIFKMIRTQGVEQGKSKILNNITSPSKNNRSQNTFAPKTEGFDPKTFLK